MAYGNLKADNLIYDDNGVDTVVPLAHVAGKASLANPTFTGNVDLTGAVTTGVTQAAGDDSTSLATTAYVDQSNFASTTGATFTGDVKLGDDDYIKLGDSDELSLVHNNSGNSLFVSTTSLTTRGTELYFQEEGDSNKTWIQCNSNGQVGLYYDNASVLVTDQSGVDVTGDLDVSGKLEVTGIDNGGQFNIKSGGAFFKYENTGAWHLIYDDSGPNSGWSYAIDATKDYVRLYGPGGSGSTVVLETKTGGVDVTGDLDVTGDITAVDVTITGVATGGVYDATTDATSAAAAWAIDFADGNNQKVTLVSTNLLSVIPTNQTVGQTGSIFITQPATPLNLGWHADWKWAGGVAPSLTQTGGATDRLDYTILAANTIHAVLTLAVA